MTHRIMSKLGHLINGESNSLSDLNEAIVVGKEGRAMRSNDCLREDWSDKVGKIFTCDVDHMYASVNDMQSKDREISHLKELLLVHLDLIQRQSELIMTRDKEITVLREERDMLRQRFQRMERRVTLQRHRDEPSSSAGLQTIPSDTPCTSALPMAAASLSPASPADQLPKRRRNSGTCLSRRKRRTISACSTDIRNASSSISDSNDIDRQSRLRVPMTTDLAYFTSAGNLKDVWMPADLQVAPEPQLQEEVQVPSWREKIYTPLYAIEGTENLDDEVFLKRHQKHETDERRRKRWDIQRIREQTHVEKLKQRGLKGRGRCKVNTSSSPDRQIFSFFPDPEDVLEVRVDDSLPVVAFGLPLRVFEPCEFSLSWRNPQEPTPRPR